jgi:hypothetical protein
MAKIIDKIKADMALNQVFCRLVSPPNICKLLSFYYYGMGSIRRERRRERVEKILPALLDTICD